MEIVYIVTHLVMAICLFAIIHVSLTSPETSVDQYYSLMSSPLLKDGLKSIERTVYTMYRIAMSILITYIK